MKPERCQATAASGKPCSATPRPGHPYCLWHDPAAADERRELSRKGGHGRSNAARARRTLPHDVLTPADLQGVLGRTLRGLIAGKVEPGVANAAANLGRAIVAVREATELEERLTALEAAAGIGRRPTA